jgi:hypothetical protein
MTVTLIFPPTVSSGFGAYYPSLPVLAGYLGEAGVQVSQLDLNEMLAEYLLVPERLSQLSEGLFPVPLALDHIACVAARLLFKNRAQLFDDQGRHRFSERQETPSYLLTTLAQPFTVDLTVRETLSLIADRGPLTLWYLKFFEEVDLSSRLLADVNLIGISVPMGPQLFPGLILSSVLRALFPRARIVLGGPTMSLMDQGAIGSILTSHCSVDAVVRYDGEIPLLALARQAEAGEWRPEKVGSTSAFRDKVLHNQSAAGPALNTLPFAYYDPSLLNQLAYPEFGIVQTRGCYWGRCAYCDFVELYDGSPGYRMRSPANFISEIENLIQLRGARRFSLITEAISPSFALKFSRLVIERGLKIEWNSFAMVDRHFRDEHFQAMARAGCDHLVIGLETMTNRVLKIVDKFATSVDNERFLRAASWSCPR